MSVCNIQGPKTTIATSTARIFGMNVNVCSLIWVVAWKILITNPTTNPIPNMGAATVITVHKASLPTAITNVSVKFVPTFRFNKLLPEAQNQ